MTYLIINKYINRDVANFELRNEKFEKINIRGKETLPYKVGDFVLVDIINGKQQITSKVVQPVDYLAYFPRSKFSDEELREQLKNFIEEIKDDELNLIVSEMLETEPNFYLMPAAKTIHHAYIGGLCEHTLGMLALAKAMHKNYQFNLDLVYSAIILHDLSKTEELESFGLTYSVEGNLIGHIVMVVNKLYYTLKQANLEKSEKFIILEHILLAHHGKFEYGSPKEPMTLEAYVVSVIDDFDAKMNYLENALKETKAGEFTGNLLGFDRKKFYKMNEEK